MDQVQGAVSQVQPQAVALKALEQSQEIDSKIIEESLSNLPSATVKFSYQDLYFALSVSSKKIVDEINSILGEKVPGGVQSLEPEEVTPEATADRIMKGISGLFSVYADQNPDMEDEELVSSFIDQVKKGVNSGYDDAFSTLEGLGAFDVEAVQSGVEKTRSLLDNKVVELESSLRKSLGLSNESIEESIAEDVNQEFVKLAGGQTLDIAA